MLAAAALIPLLLHLRRGKVTRVVEFPGARYLARATQEHQRALRVRSSFLLLIQLAIVALVALAAARPLARLGTGHAPAAVAIVLDNSMSTGVVVNGRPLLDALKDVARTALTRSTPQDRIWLVTAAGGVAEGDASSLGSVLDTLRPLAGAGSPRDAVALAWASTSRTRGLPPTIGVITDGQRTTWNGQVSAGPSVAIFTPLGAVPSGHGVIVAEPRPARWTGRGSVHVAIRGADSVSFRVTIDERTVARGTAPPDGAVDVAAPASGAGWGVGRVELPRDELAADDSRMFAVWRGSPPGVDARAGGFVADAASALVAAGTIRTGSDVQIVSANDVRSLPSLVVAPQQESAIGAANLALARVGIPWRFGAVRRSEALARGPGINSTVRLRFAMAPTTTQPADTLATVSGEPWIVAGDGYVLVASPLDTSATNLPVTADFVPWLARSVIERLAPGGGPVSFAGPLARIAVPLGADSLQVMGAPSIAVGDTATMPPRAGVYFWTRGATRIGAVVVNAEAEESDLRRDDDRELTARFAPAAGRMTHDADSFARRLYGNAAQRPVAVPQLVGALLLLIVETMIARPSRGIPDAARRAAREAA
jgi:hypothetical protein